MAAASVPFLTRLLAGTHTEPDSSTERILDAAVEQFKEFGLRRTSIEDVARAAGVARITVYRRFPGKEALIEAVLMREARRFLAELDSSVARGLKVEEQIADGFVIALRAANHPLVGRLLAADPEVTLPFLTVNAGPALALARGFLASRIREAKAKRLIPEDIEPEQVAEVVVRLTLSFLLVRESCVAVDDAEEARRFARRHIAPLITGRKSRG